MLEPDLHFKRASALDALGRAEEALAALDEAIRLRPAHLEALLDR